jgi:hypothetical protein
VKTHTVEHEFGAESGLRTRIATDMIGASKARLFSPRSLAFVMPIAARVR